MLCYSAHLSPIIVRDFSAVAQPSEVPVVVGCGQSYPVLCGKCILICNLTHNKYLRNTSSIFWCGFLPIDAALPGVVVRQALWEDVTCDILRLSSQIKRLQKAFGTFGQQIFWPWASHQQHVRSLGIPILQRLKCLDAAAQIDRLWYVFYIDNKMLSIVKSTVPLRWSRLQPFSPSSAFPNLWGAGDLGVDLMPLVKI